MKDMTDKRKTEIQKEILASLDPNPHGRLLLAQRIGKTKIGIDIIKRDKPKSVLWVSPSNKLIDEDIPSEFATWRAMKYLDRVTFVTWMSLHKMKGHFDFIILDEEQFITENNAIGLIGKDLTYNNIISMTGKSSKHEDKRELYLELGLKVLYEIPINEAVDIGILSNYQINVVTTTMNRLKNMEVGNKHKKFFTSEERNYAYLTRMVKKAMRRGNPKDIMFRVLARMRAVKNSPAKHVVAHWLFNKLEGRKLFFCASIDQAEKLSSYTYHSKTDNEDLRTFLRGDVDSIAMVNAGGTGFTYRNLDHLALIQVDSDKNGLTTQKIARTLLKQKDYKATVWIVCLLGTKDVDWVQSALEGFDPDKVEYMTFKEVQELYTKEVQC